MTRAARGFTLLEMLAAIMILALAFTMLLKAMGASLALTRKAATRTEVAAMAQSLLDGVYVMSPPRPGVTRGRFDREHQWRLSVEPWYPPAARKRGPDGGHGNRHGTVGAQAPRLYKLDLAVTWGPPARRQEAHFVTLRVADPSSGGGGSP